MRIARLIRELAAEQLDFMSTGEKYGSEQIQVKPRADTSTRRKRLFRSGWGFCYDWRDKRTRGSTGASHMKKGSMDVS